MVRFTVAADGFLYNMVRIMTGHFARRAAGGAFVPEDTSEDHRGKSRKLAGPTAPACGLYLEKCFYKPADIMPAVRLDNVLYSDFITRNKGEKYGKKKSMKRKKKHALRKKKQPPVQDMPDETEHPALEKKKPHRIEAFCTASLRHCSSQ